jgi:hypothetical protein
MSPPVPRAPAPVVVLEAPPVPGPLDEDEVAAEVKRVESAIGEHANPNAAETASTHRAERKKARIGYLSGARREAGSAMLLLTSIGPILARGRRP